MAASNELIVRDYSEADQDYVWELHHLGLDQFGVNLGPGPWDDDLRDIPGVYLHDRGAFLVGECGNRIVAMGALRRVSQECAEIKRMRVRPDFQRRGFGRALLRALEARAWMLGYRRLVLDTTAQQVPAQALYRSYGFKETGRVEKGGVECIVFEKNVGRFDDLSTL